MKESTTAPTKTEAVLSSCSSEKLVATVEASTLECKQLERRIKELESRIKDNCVAISGSLENDILKIMSTSQNLDTTPPPPPPPQHEVRLKAANKAFAK